MKLFIALTLCAALLAGCAGQPPADTPPATQEAPAATPALSSAQAPFPTQAPTASPTPEPTPKPVQVSREIRKITLDSLDGLTQPHYLSMDENGNDAEMPEDIGDWFVNMRLIDTVLPQGQSLALGSPDGGKITFTVAEGSFLTLTVEVDGDRYEIDIGPGTTFTPRNPPAG